MTRQRPLLSAGSIVWGYIVFSALVCSSCGGGAPGTPSAVGIAGSWSGTFTDATFGNVGPATATFTQSNTSVIGQISLLPPDPIVPTLRINLTGTLSDNALTGTVMVPICGNGSGPISGNLDNGVLRISLPTVDGTLCTFILDGTLVPRRT